MPRLKPGLPTAILDLATGSGVLARELQRQIPAARVVGADFCAPMLAVARRRGITELVVADGLALPFQNSQFERRDCCLRLAEYGFVRHCAVRSERVLLPGGHLLILDFSLPNPPLLALYRIYLHRVLPILAGWLTGEPDAYHYFVGNNRKLSEGQRHAGAFAPVRISKLRGLKTPLVGSRYGVIRGQKGLEP